MSGYYFIFSNINRTSFFDRIPAGLKPSHCMKHGCFAPKWVTMYNIYLIDPATGELDKGSWYVTSPPTLPTTPKTLPSWIIKANPSCLYHYQSLWKHCFQLTSINIYIKDVRIQCAFESKAILKIVNVGYYYTLVFSKLQN